jgi:hypothetical protein
MLGRDAYQMANDQFNSMLKQVEANKELTTSTDFDELSENAAA